MTPRIIPAIAAIVLLAGAAGPVAAHGPDPMFGGTPWAQDQVVSFTWKADQVPPAWATSAIDAGAADSNVSRASRSARFLRSSGATSLIAYGEPTGCGAGGLACMSRVNAPTSFRMWFRVHGYAFDWGRLRWCQALAALASGCYDVENVALDEFGHVEILEHHANLSGEGDYLDAVVQTKSRTFPNAGWNAHAYGRCDTARLQLEYERIGAGFPFSTCLNVATTTTLVPSATAVSRGGSVRFTANLSAANVSANRALAGDAISSRPVALQRRTPGSTAWTTVGTMAASTTIIGSYSMTVTPVATYEWRASFAKPANEGLLGSDSAVIRVTVSG